MLFFRIRQDWKYGYDISRNTGPEVGDSVSDSHAAGGAEAAGDGMGDVRSRQAASTFVSAYSGRPAFCPGAPGCAGGKASRSGRVEWGINVCAAQNRDLAVARRASLLASREPGMGERDAARAGLYRERLGGSVLGVGQHDRNLQAFRRPDMGLGGKAVWI